MSLEPSSSTALLEGWLTPEQRFVVRDMASRLGLSHVEWPQLPAARNAFETLACVQRRDALRFERGLSPTAALRLACAEAGLRFETIRARVYAAESHRRIT